MKQEQLERANEIDKQLTVLKSNLSTWEGASEFYEQMSVRVNGAGHHVNMDFVDFPKLKSDTIRTIKTCIEHLEQEFINL